jgi:hypothetical protein
VGHLHWLDYRICSVDAKVTTPDRVFCRVVAGELPCDFFLDKAGVVALWTFTRPLLVTSLVLPKDQVRSL